MLAIVSLLELGFNIKEILSSIKSIEFAIPGRFNVLSIDAPYNVIIDYAHTPDGIKNVLSTINRLPVGKIITVFGCGGNRDKTKRSEMGKVAASLSSQVIVTSDNPRDENPEAIIDDIVRGNENKNIIRIVERRSAIEYALSIAKTSDVVVILGKGAENYQEIKGVKMQYSDYVVVDNYFKYLPKGELKLW